MTAEAHALTWLRPDAPYAPFVQVGLLAALRVVDSQATTNWEAGPDHFVAQCTLRTRCDLDEVATAIADAPWPDVQALLGVEKVPQSIGSVLKQASDKVAEWRALAGPESASAVRPPGSGLDAARRHVAALLTDGALNNDGALGRSRLVGGVKSDLSGVGPIKLKPSVLAEELAAGPRWAAKSAAGTGLGLVPEVQTYGGVTGPKPDSVNESSALLYALIVHALAVLPPFAVLRGTRRTAGGPLWTAEGLVWPIHAAPRHLRALLALYGSVDADVRRHRGVVAVYRSRPRPINTTISMFPWGERIA